MTEVLFLVAIVAAWIVCSIPFAILVGKTIHRGNPSEEDQ